MADPFVGEIRMFAGTFAPLGWAFCNGALFSVDDNLALFSLIGATYGGDGVITFAVPDLRGRLPMHQGQGPGLNNRIIGQSFGTETVQLTSPQMPVHVHALGGPASSAAATSASPVGAVPAVLPAGNAYADTGAAVMAPAPSVAGSPGNTGGSSPHENLMPYTCVNFIICMEGVFPSRP